MAEGRVYAPLLPSFAQGHKGGFATLHSRPPSVLPDSNRVSLEGKPYPESVRRETPGQPQDNPKLGTRPDQPDRKGLAGDSIGVGRTCSQSIDGIVTENHKG